MKHVDIIMKTLKMHARSFKQPIVTELANTRGDPYLVLISCLISLRTKDDVTAAASLRLFKLAETPEEMINVPLKKIEKAIYPAGFYKTKARRIKSISSDLITKYKGKVPNDFDTLLSLKGVGRKTANIVMVYGFDDDNHIPIDTHCHRIPNRLGWLDTKTPEQTEQQLLKELPKKYWHDFNDLFVQFGQNICLPVSPLCSTCPIEKYCQKVGVEKHR